MQKHETPGIKSSSFDGDILTITFENGETYRWQGVPQATYDVFKVDPTYMNFALLIRPYYTLMGGVVIGESPSS